MTDAAGLLGRTVAADVAYVYICERPSLSIYVPLRPLSNQLQPVNGSALTMKCDHTAGWGMRMRRGCWGGIWGRNRSMKDTNRWRQACEKSPVLLPGKREKVGEGVGSEGAVVTLNHPNVDRDVLR